jgi:hypothetical protein
MSISIWSVLFLVGGFFLGKWWAGRGESLPSLDPELKYLKDLLDSKKKAAVEAAAKDDEEKAKAKVKELLGS